MKKVWTNSQQLAPSITLTTNKLDHARHSCKLGKAKKGSYPKHSNFRASKPGELVHSDICGPIQPSRGFKYFLVFIDDYSRYSQVFLLNQKSEAFHFFLLSWLFINSSNKTLENPHFPLQDLWSTNFQSLWTSHSFQSLWTSHSLLSHWQWNRP